MSHVLSTYLGILPNTTEAGVLRLLVQTGVTAVGAGEGSLLVLDEASGVLRFAMTIGSSEQTLLGQTVPLGEGITGLAAATHQVQIGAPTFGGVRQDDAKRAGPEAVIAAPMLVGETLVGVMTAVSFKEGKRFTSADGSLYGGLATIAGVVVDQRRRLAAYEGEHSDVPAALSTLAGPERQVLESLRRVSAQRPAAIRQLAAILAAVETLALGEG